MHGLRENQHCHEKITKKQNTCNEELRGKLFETKGRQAFIPSQYQAAFLQILCISLCYRFVAKLKLNG